MESKSWLARNLATAFLSVDWSPHAMERAGLAVLDNEPANNWLQDLVAEILTGTTTPYPPSPVKLARSIVNSGALERRWTSALKRPVLKTVVTSPAKFAPLPAFRDLGIPELSSQEALAAWLALPLPQVRWLADAEGYRASAGREAMRHYCYTWLLKKSGPPRLLEAPKPRLKAVQRRILRELLAPAPLHACVHGYRKGHSCLTAAQLHAGEQVVISVDLKDFFLRIPVRQVHGLFRSLGFPWEVARVLTGFCSTRTPADILEASGRLDWQTQKDFGQAHLPQGAPTSPALANLCTWRLDCRLHGLAASCDARYSRYADDLAFSGDRDFARRADGFIAAVAEICRAMGHAINPRKTRVMGQADRQRLTGLVINRHVNVARDDYDRLKAILCNCRRHGPASQNRERHHDFRAHLDGRITWVENVNPHRGRRLRLLFQGIDWST